MPTTSPNAFEPRMRALVAEHLGIHADDLRPTVSLSDDLAVDSLDLAELGVAIESEFDLELPEQLLAQVRTYEDLVRGTLELAILGRRERATRRG